MYFILHRDSINAKGGDKLTFGERLKKIRQDKGMSQRELGKILGVTQQTIAQYEKIKEAPKAETLQKLANALDVSVHQLRGESYTPSDIFEALHNLSTNPDNVDIYTGTEAFINASYWNTVNKNHPQTLSFAEYLEKAKAGNLSLTDLFDMWLQANEIEWKRAQRYGKQGREFTFEDFTEESYFVTESQFKIIRKGNIEYVKSRIREFDESNKDSQD